MQIELILPFPPTVNHYWIRTKTRNVCLSAEARQYRDDVTIAVMRQLRPPWPRLKSRLAVDVELSAPDRRRWDLDNRQKAIWDALQHASIFEDDGQIDRMLIERMPPCSTGYAKVRIVEI